jgi:hypothetical protein
MAPTHMTLDQRRSEEKPILVYPQIPAWPGTITQRRERFRRGLPSPPFAARFRRSRIWRVPFSLGGTKYMGITWAMHGQSVADCDRGCLPAAYRPRHAVTTRWPARLAAAPAHALRLGRNALAMLAGAWPGCHGHHGAKPGVTATAPGNPSAGHQGWGGTRRQTATAGVSEFASSGGTIGPPDAGLVRSGHRYG